MLNFQETRLIFLPLEMTRNEPIFEGFLTENNYKLDLFLQKRETRNETCLHYSCRPGVNNSKLLASSKKKVGLLLKKQFFLIPCFLLTFINILKYFNVTRLPLFTPISLTNTSTLSFFALFLTPVLFQFHLPNYFYWLENLKIITSY